tara:strand:- start:240 stop:785 length:546 start_codon:yes stop_codon:yes gene_type:complete
MGKYPYFPSVISKWVKAQTHKEIATPTTPASGYDKLYFKTDGKLYKLNSSGVESTIHTNTETIPIALGDESTVLATASTSVPVVTYNIPYGFEVTNVIISATVAGTGAGLVTVDIHDDGTTILSTKVTLDSTEKTSATASTQPVISSSTIVANSLIEIFVDVIDTDNVCAGLKVWLIGYQT